MHSKYLTNLLSIAQETVHIAFPLSHEPSGSYLSIATALSLSPKLQVVRTQIPVVWNPSLLTISENPALQKIELRNLFQHEGQPILGSGRFLMQARRYPRLSGLVAAGTCVIFFADSLSFYHPCDKRLTDLVLMLIWFSRHIIRPRAHTVATSDSPVTSVIRSTSLLEEYLTPSTSLPRYLDLQT